MAKPVAGDIVVLPFPQSNLQVGKRRPALVLASLPGDDLVLCQVISQSRPDPYAIPLTNADLERGQLAVDSYARVSRLFTVDQSVVVYVAASVLPAKITEAKAKARHLFA